MNLLPGTGEGVSIVHDEERTCDVSTENSQITHTLHQNNHQVAEVMAGQIIVQSLSVDTPGKCPNACKYCVSAMHAEELGPVTAGARIKDEFINQYREALRYIRSRGTETLMFTGSDADPMANIRFLEHLCEINRELGDKGFTKIEIQTSGILMTDENITKLKEMGIKTVAFSLSSINDDENSAISGIRHNLQFQILDVCERIKAAGLNLRLCFNLNDAYHKCVDIGLSGFFQTCKAHGADQLTFRELYTNGHGPIDEWITKHRFDVKRLEAIKQYVRDNGRVLSVLPFGTTQYEVNGMSILIDDDSMGKNKKTPTYKYAVLRPNGNMYIDWDSLENPILIHS